MDKFIHIVFGDSAAGVLRYFLNKGEHEFNGKVINFSDDFSIGPIYEIDTEEGFRRRLEWFRSVFEKIGELDWFEEAAKGIVDSYEKVRSVGQGANIIVWHGENASNQAGLRYLSSVLDEKDMYELDISKAIGTVRGENEYIPRSLAEMSPEDIGDIIFHVKKVEKEKHAALKEEWKHLRDSPENLRILKGEGVFGVNDEYYDDEILLSCTYNFKKAARVIGKIMGKSEQLIGDMYIDYRLRALIESKKIEGRGSIKRMRDFDVRVKYSLNEFFKALFKKECDKDEDGFYHYLIEENEYGLEVDTVYIGDWWKRVDMSNKLILDYDDSNMFSLTWFKEGVELIRINHVLIGRAEYKTEEYVDENGENVKEESVVLHMDNGSNQYIQIQMRPHMSIRLGSRECPNQ
ncbi:protein of unknown function [Peptoclostridium litorale DSM 5388]|uniref:DUF1835 domain-containing protein n=1 Tax=Peptoclostridium litorale DSM 5388 TaxID=1121324 RepID=A0A069RFT5_PEPLI|nr:DUF1835 domain-containing protein [Peptoclostridium litorale]KDR95886.1 hypothetical protein CLIT_8c00550 [Peptoclostridium litorale DSM 5388]SIO10673.1 protein of unknown function [Peptoclostridium litorale DSM 5388]